MLIELWDGNGPSRYVEVDELPVALYAELRAAMVLFNAWVLTDSSLVYVINGMRPENVGNFSSAVNR